MGHGQGKGRGGGGLNTDLMEVIRLLMESDTVREWPASTDQVGGSLGLRTNERAVSSRKVELSSMQRAERTIGSCAADPFRGRGRKKRNTKKHKNEMKATPVQGGSY